MTTWTRQDPAGHGNLPAPLDHPQDDFRAQAREKGWTFLDISDPDLALDPAAAALLAPKDARRLQAVPVAADDGEVLVAVADPDDITTTDELRRLLAGHTVRRVAAEPGALRRFIEEHFSALSEAGKIPKGTRRARRGRTLQPGGVTVLADTSGTPVEDLLELLMEQAVKSRASDIHIEQVTVGCDVRFRVDKNLRPVDLYSREVGSELISLIKTRSAMPPEVSLLPDSGRMSYQYLDGSTRDIRVEVTPTVHGTSAVLRLAASGVRRLDELGMSETNLDRYMRALNQPSGIIVVIGPTGSGKTTTLYSSVAHKMGPETKIITLEDPVEFTMDRYVSQIEISEAQSLTFDEGLRSIVRSDPNSILVGEIRDAATARAAVTAALTGHLVFTTVHAIDTSRMMTRLQQIDVKPAAFAPSVLCIVAQSLVRKLCPSCRVRVAVTPAHRRAAGWEQDQTPESIFEARPGGCGDCEGEGYHGIIPLHEVLLTTPALEEALSAPLLPSQIESLARDTQMTTMREDGLEKVKQGLTTIEQLNANTRRPMI